MDRGPEIPRGSGDLRNTPPGGTPSPRETPLDGLPAHPPARERPEGRTPPSGAPIPPDAPMRPIVQGPPRRGPGGRPGASEPPHDPHETPSGAQDIPDVWGRPPESGPPSGPGRPGPHGHGPAPEDEGPWGALPEAQDPVLEKAGARFASDQPGPRETAGVEVRLGTRAGERARERERERERERREPRRRGGRGVLAAVGVLVVAGLVAAGLVLTRGADGGGEPQAGGPRTQLQDVEPPPAGKPVEVGTVDGFRYRLAAVRSGLDKEAARAARGSLPPGTTYPYIDYLLSNPTDDEVLLEYPGDVFLKRNLIVRQARGRCEPKLGVPNYMCTPPTQSKVVRRLIGGELVPGDGGDQYMPPKSTYLVRITVQVPVDSDISSRDLRLYVWEQIYRGTNPALLVPFPR